MDRLPLFPANPPQTRPRGRRVVLQFADTRISLPCGDAYEAQIVADHVRATVRRHGRLELRIGDHSWTVASAVETCGADCRGCLSHERPAAAGTVVCEVCSARHLLSLDRLSSSAAA